ncbi:MAG TPA: polysaccharide biosynthesis tyrosine autokinase [Trichocoleus sp.]|jgi:capsular exopolysaccharide synthesis family protein
MEKSPSKLSTTQTNGSVPAFIPFPAQLTGQMPAQSTEANGDLQQLLGMVRRRSLVIVSVAITTLLGTVAFSILQKPLYQGSFRILIEPVNANERDVSQLTTERNNSSQSTLDYSTQIQVLQSPQLLNEIAQKLQKTYPDLSYNSLIADLSVARIGQTKILEIRYRNSDPTKVIAVLDQASQDYLDYSLKERQTNLRQGIQFIQNQLPSNQSRVQQLQNELQTLRQKYGFIDPSNYAEGKISQLASIAEKRQEIAQALTEAGSSYSALKQESGAVAALNNAPAYQSLVNELRQVEVQISSEQTRFQDDSLNIQVLREKRQNLLPLLREEAERVVGSKLAEAATQIQTLEVQQQALAQTQQELEQQSAELPRVARQYSNIQQELQSATDSLNRFLKAREDLQIEAAQKEIPWQLVQPPTKPPALISADFGQNMLLGSLAGLALGMAAAWLLEKFDNTYHSVEELKRKTKLPLLGTIPWHRQLHDIQLESLTTSDRLPMQQVQDKTEEPTEKTSVFLTQSSAGQLYHSTKFLDALRVLHINIQLLNSDRRIRSLVISSAFAGEGKSTIALYLAQTAAEMGLRVLLVDADLRRSQIGNRLPFIRSKGLSHFLTESISLKEVIQQPLPIPNFYVLPAGEPAADPAQLLASFKMQRLIEVCHRTFDLVVYDTPNILELADVSLIAPRTDGVVLVAQLDKTEQSALSQAMDSLKMTQIPMLGVIANKG